jgi:hypothetical protein
MTDEAQALLNKYTAQMTAVMEAFRIEATALAWKIAADLVAKNLPERVAVGSLSYNGKKTEMVIPAPKKHKAKPEAKVIKGSGTIQPKRADQYTDLLVGKRHGIWSRRGSTKVTYTCEGWKGVPNGMKPVFYIMKNTKSGKTITVKFDSIVRDWTYVAANEEVRSAA